MSTVSENMPDEVGGFGLCHKIERCGPFVLADAHYLILIRPAVKKQTPQPGTLY